MKRLARIGLALACAQRIAVAPHRERYEHAEHLHRVGRTIRRTRPGR